jgi:hypothetical protein
LTRAAGLHGLPLLPQSCTDGHGVPSPYNTWRLAQRR